MIKVLHFCSLAFIMYRTLTLPVFAQQDTIVQLTAETDNIFLCPNKQEAYLYVNLKACSLGKRVPLNISVVFDRSGSMEGERIHYGKRAIEYLIDQLQPDDIMSLVIYDHEAFVLHGSEPVSDKQALKRKLEHIHARGATNLMAGLELGVQEVVSTYDKTKINRVFLFTDGQPNEGITDPDILEHIVSEQAHKYDISVSTFGLGHEFNEFIMHGISEAGAGNYYYIQSHTDIINTISQEIQKVNSVVAQNAKLIIDYPSQHLDVSRVYGHPYKELNGQIYIDMKEIHPNEITGILIKFTVVNRPMNNLNFKSRLTYFNSLSKTIGILEKVNVISPANNGQNCSDSYNANVLEQMVYYSSHYLLESAIKDADNENVLAARKKVGEAKQLISQSPVPPDSPLLASQNKILNDYDTHLATAHTKSEYHRRHTQKKIHHSNYLLRKNKK